MRRVDFCTYYDSRYVGKALALFESLRDFAVGCEVRVFALCADEFSRLVTNKLAPSFVKTVPLHELEERDELLRTARSNRDRVEYLWTLTPCLMLYLLQKHRDIEILNYVDADLCFYSDPSAILDELGDRSILIHPHDFTDGLEAVHAAGIYNVGLVSARNSPEGQAVVNWWCERCLEWCYKRLEDGKFGDQGYLNDWPERFPSVRVSAHPGIGVGPWNMEKYSWERDGNSTLLVNGRPVVFFHYHGCTFINEAVVIPFSNPFYRFEPIIIESIVFPYMTRLAKALHDIRQLSPTFNLGYTDQDFELTAELCFIVKDEFRHLVNIAALPHVPHQFRDWTLFASPQYRLS